MYVKRMCSNAGKLLMTCLEELKAWGCKAEVLMNDINWDQTVCATGQWTMHQAKAKVIPITSSDDKRQITAVLATSLTGEYLSKVTSDGNERILLSK